MKTIHKQVIPWNANDEVSIETPIHALHLDVQLQKSVGGVSEMVVWYLCDPKESQKQNLTFRIVGTGWELTDDFANTHFWLKTLQHEGYVWHVFFKKESEVMEIRA